MTLIQPSQMLWLALCRAGVKAYMQKIVMRNNTITGRLYRDEPAILAWDVCNEPLFPGDDTGKLLTVRSSLACLLSADLFLSIRFHF